MNDYTRGLRAGIPIGLGYLSVSFAFGVMAMSLGLFWWEAVLVSMLTLTSAGQLSGVGLMVLPGQSIAMLVSQFTINVRYAFMSVSLSQRLDSNFSGIYRWLLGFFITDEIFAVASREERVTRSFFAGVATLPYVGWSVGTLEGALLGSVLPQRLMSALGIAIYGMFVAIVVPEMKKSRPVTVVVILAAIVSCLFAFVPVLTRVSGGIAISVAAVAAAVCGAVFFPVDGAGKEEQA